VVVLERQLTAQLTWFAADKPEFKTAIRRTGTVRAGQPFSLRPDSAESDLRSEQQAGRLTFRSFNAATRMTDLGDQPLDPSQAFDVGFLTFAEPSGAVQTGHVYLFHEESAEPGYWALFRVDAIGDGLAKPPATAPPPVR
jgi:hypothetical protein